MQQEVTAPLHSAPDLFSVSIDLGNLSDHLSPLRSTSAQTFWGNAGAVKHFPFFFFFLRTLEKLFKHNILKKCIRDFFLQGNREKKSFFSHVSKTSHYPHPKKVTVYLII